MKEVLVETLRNGMAVEFMDTDVSKWCMQNCSRLQAQIEADRQSVAGSVREIEDGRVEIRPGFLRCLTICPIDDVCTLTRTSVTLHYRTPEEKAAFLASAEPHSEIGPL